MIEDQKQLTLWLENQSREMDLRQQELAISQEQMRINGSLSEKSIDAQLQLHQADHECGVSISKNKIVLWIVVALCVTAFSIYALYLQKSEVVVELVKLAATAVGAGFGGFAYDYHQAKSESD